MLKLIKEVNLSLYIRVNVNKK